ncbi:ankyrin, partial [Morchella conica CCBAS932]
ETALHWAARSRQVAVLKMLVDAGADITAMDEDGNTPLHRAVCAGSRLAGPGEAVGVLLEWGADIEAKDERGRTPLACASEGANEGLVKMLLEKGADINTEDNAGQRVLHRAACGGNATVLKLLV